MQLFKNYITVQLKFQNGTVELLLWLTDHGSLFQLLSSQKLLVHLKCKGTLFQWLPQFSLTYKISDGLHGVFSRKYFIPTTYISIQGFAIKTIPAFKGLL